MKTGTKSSCKIYESPGIQRGQLKKNKNLLFKIHNVNPTIIITIESSQLLTATGTCPFGDALKERSVQYFPNLTVKDCCLFLKIA